MKKSQKTQQLGSLYIALTFDIQLYMCGLGKKLTSIINNDFPEFRHKIIFYKDQLKHNPKLNIAPSCLCS